MDGTKRASRPVVMRVATLIGLGACALAGVTACDRDAGPQVAFLLASHLPRDVRSFEARADEIDLRVVTLAADRDTSTQIAQVEDVLARGAKVLVIQPTDSRLAARYIALAHDKGARVIAYERAIVAPDLDYFVSHDSYRIGVLQAEAALLATAGKGSYVLLSGAADDAVAADITRGYKDTLAPYIARGDVTIVMEQNHSAWSAEQARVTVDTALARSVQSSHEPSPIDAILANNSAMARGAVDALAARGPSNTFIAGADADVENVNLVCQGKQTVEILKDSQPLARTAADVAIRLYQGRPAEPGSSIALAGTTVPVAAVRVELVTSDNVKSMIVDSGILSPDELPGCKHRLASAR